MSAARTERPPFFNALRFWRKTPLNGLFSPTREQLDRAAMTPEAEIARQRLTGDIPPIAREQARGDVASRILDRLSPPGSPPDERLVAYDSAVISAGRRSEQEMDEAVRKRAVGVLEKLGLACKWPPPPTNTPGR